MEGTKTHKQVLQYFISKNQFQTGTGYYGRLVTGKHITNEDVAKLISKRGSTVTIQDSLIVLNFIGPVLLDELIRGNTIEIGPFRVHLVVKGQFSDEEDGWEDDRNSLSISVSVAGYMMEDLMPLVQIEKTSHHAPSPELTSFIDDITGKRNSIITPLETGTLNGKMIRIDREDPQQGIFFVKEDDGTEVKVPYPSANKPSFLTFKIPELTPGGVYLIKVKVKNVSGKLLEGQLAVPLTAV